MTRVSRVSLAWLLACLPATLGHGAIGDIVRLYPVEAPPTPFLFWTHPAVVWLWSPILLVSALVLFLTPGLLWVATRPGGPGGFDRWLLYGFAAAIPLVSLPAWLIGAVVGRSPTGTGFALLVLAVSAIILVVSSRRVAVGEVIGRCPTSPGDLLSLAGPVVGLTLLFLPKLFWESFNGDGAHAFEASRLLLHRGLPFFEQAAGPVAGFPGATSMIFAYPTSWFIRLFGEYEFAARAPFLLYLPLVAAAVAALAADRGRPARTVRSWSWAPLAAYAMAMAFSATYSPYFADIALPATQDTLLMVSFFGFLLAVDRGEHGWMAMFTLLVVTSLPSGLLLIGFWWLATAALIRPRPTSMLGRVAVTALVIVGALTLVPFLLEVLGLPAPGSEYGGSGLLTRLARLRLLEWHRFVYWIVGGGIAPVLSLTLWKRMDPSSRVLTLVTLAYFGFLYIQSRVGLHHFVPAMLIPLVPMWRLPLERGRWRLFIAGSATLAFALTLPPTWTVHTRPKEIGAAVDDRRSGYAELDPRIFAESDVFFELFLRPGHPDVPESYGASPVALTYYSQRARRNAWVRSAAAYVLVRDDGAPPAAADTVVSASGARAFVVDRTTWRRQRETPAPSTISPLLRVDREVLFGGAGPRVIDWGGWLLRRLGR